jgi:hypothetical protein
MRHDHRSGSLIARLSVVAGLSLVASACSDDKNGSSLTGTGSTGSGTGGGTATGGGPNSGGTPGTGGVVATGGTGNTGNTGTVAACNGVPVTTGVAGATSGGGAGGACTGVELEAERIPVDLFFMMDRSISMGETLPSGLTRWEALHAAVQSFVNLAGTGDIRTGIGFLSRTGGADDSQCPPDQYANPVVPIGPLSTTGTPILDAMAALTPAGLTPLVPALEGAIQYARQYATANPGRLTAVALVSDGYPTQCGNAPSAVADAARAGFEGTPSIRTYVLGVGQVAAFNLRSYAQEGGTVSAFTVDDADVTGSFVETLNNITESPLACQFDIPPPTTNNWVDYDHVQVVFHPAVGDSEEMPYLTSSSACATAPNGGWYYDVDPNVADPTVIRMCPCSCARFGAGVVDIRVGCTPAIGPR